MNCKKIMILSDIHSNYDSLKYLMDLPEYNESFIIFAGDYVDGFNLKKGDVKNTLELIYNICNQGKGIALMGNHDLEFLKALNTKPGEYNLWLKIGGKETLKSLGLKPRIVKEEIEEVLSKEIIDFIKSMPYYYTHKNLVVFHAGVKVHLDLEDNDKEDMLWVRGAYYNTKGSENHYYKDKVLVSGHTPNNFLSGNGDLSILYDSKVGKCRYFIDGGSNGGLNNKGQINVLLLDDNNEYLQAYKLTSQGYQKDTIYKRYF